MPGSCTKLCRLQVCVLQAYANALTLGYNAMKNWFWVRRRRFDIFQNADMLHEGIYIRAYEAQV